MTIGSAAHRNGRRLLRLVNALLDFARLEAGQATVRPQVVDLRELAAADSPNPICEAIRTGRASVCRPG